MRGTLTSLAPPKLGAYSADPPPFIPDGYLWRSSNVVERDGMIAPRPGYEKVVATGPGGRIMGGFYFKTATLARRIVVANRTGWWQLTGNAWVNISGTALTGDENNPVRFAVFPSSGTNYLIGVNNADSPKVWDGAAATYSALGGSPPIARDVLVAGGHVVMLNVVEAGNRAITRIRTSAYNDHATWTATLTADLPDSIGEIVGGKVLGRTAFVVYCEGNAWIATLQAGSAFPFRFDRLEDWPGPVSPAAIVGVGRQHFYLGNDARIYRCDGLSIQPISRPIDTDLQSGISTGLRLIDKRKAWGMFSQRDMTVWFFYPGPTSSNPDRAVCYDLRTGALYLHALPVSMSSGWSGDEVASVTWADLAGFTWANIAATYPTWDAFGGTLQQADFLGSAQGQVYRMRRDIDDDGTPIVMSWEYPLRAWSGLGVRTRVDAVECAFEQVTGGPKVTVQVGLSEALAEAGDPTYVSPTKNSNDATITTHDTAVSARQVLTFDGVAGNEGRFANVKCSVTTSKKLRFKGAALHTWSEAVV